MKHKQNQKINQRVYYRFFSYCRQFSINPSKIFYPYLKKSAEMTAQVRSNMAAEIEFSELKFSINSAIRPMPEYEAVRLLINVFSVQRQFSQCLSNEINTHIIEVINTLQQRIEEDVEEDVLTSYEYRNLNLTIEELEEVKTQFTKKQFLYCRRHLLEEIEFKSHVGKL